MHATVGDTLLVHGRTVGAGEQHGEIIEVHGDDGGPPYLVRFAGGDERLMFPGPDSEIESKQR